MDKLTFDAGLQHLKNTTPDNPWIAELDKSGYTFMATKYLAAQLASLEKKTLPEKKKKKLRSAESNPVLNDLFSQRTKLYGKRAKTSNKFHSCTTDEERAEVSTTIQDLQSQIRTITTSIDTYMDTGQLPETAERFPIPKAPLEKNKLLLRLRSQCSNKKSDIKKLHNKITANSQNPTANSQLKKLEYRLEKAEAKLKELETYKAYVEAAIQD